MSERCCVKVSGQGGWHQFTVKDHEYGCERAGKHERDGKFYCWQHDPERVAKRHAEAVEKSNRRREADEAVTAEGQEILEALGLLSDGRVVTRDFRPVRRLSITFSDAKKLAERIKT